MRRRCAGRYRLAQAAAARRPRSARCRRCGSCRRAPRARVEGIGPRAARGDRARASRAASSRWCSSTAAATRRRCCARPAAGKRRARAARRGWSCTAKPARLALSSLRPRRSAAARLPGLRQRRPAAARARARSGSSARSRDAVPAARIAAHRSRQHARKGAFAAMREARRRRRGRHPGRHADARQGTRLPAPHAGRRARRRQRALQRRLSRDRAPVRAARAGRGPRRPRGPARRSDGADRFSAASAVSWRSPRTTTTASRRRCSPSASRSRCRRSRIWRCCWPRPRSPRTAAGVSRRGVGARPGARRGGGSCVRGVFAGARGAAAPRGIGARAGARAKRAIAARCRRSCRAGARSSSDWPSARVRWALDVDPLGLRLTAHASRPRQSERYNSQFARRSNAALTRTQNRTVERWLAEGIARVAPGAAPPAIVLERPKQAQHGDYATNVALQLAKALKRNPRELAADLVAALPRSPLLARAEVAGAGFINLFVCRRRAAGGRGADSATKAIASAARRAARGEKVIVEFVSANPTGPLHVGHGRGAALGDAIARLLACAGLCRVTASSTTTTPVRRSRISPCRCRRGRREAQGDRRELSRGRLSRRIHPRDRARYLAANPGDDLADI